MRKIVLLAYQVEVSNKIANDCDDYLMEVDGLGDECVSRRVSLKSPTGSGKTYILGEAISKVMELRNKQVAIVWLTLANGNLNEQSLLKLKHCLGTVGIPVLSIEDALLDCPNNMGGCVIVGSFNSLVNNDKGGNPTNIVMRQSENTNFPKMCANTREAGIPIILMIDETQHSDTERAKDRINNYIKPSYILTASAIPPNNVDKTFEVSWQDVVDAGMVKSFIKKETFIHPFDGIRTGCEQLKLDINLATKTGVAFLPKVLVYLPNKADVSEYQNFLCTEFGWSEESSEVAVVLSEIKSANWSDCKDNNASKVKVILTKEAISIGIDIPSISIIVQIRDGSDRVVVQRLGRGLRMPEQKHYGNDLDTLHFFVFDKHELDFSEAEYLRDSFHKVATRKLDVSKFPSITHRFVGHKKVSSEQLSNIKEKMFDVFYSRLDAIDKNIIDLKDDYEAVLSSAIIDFAKKKETNITFKNRICNNADLSWLYSNEITRKKARLARYQEAVENSVAAYLNLDEPIEGYYSRILTFIFRNKDIIDQQLDLAEQEIKKQEGVERPEVELTYLPPVKYAFATNATETEVRLLKYGYSSYYLDGREQSKIEVACEKYLDSNEHTEYWFRNYDKKIGSFSVLYLDVKGNPRDFYPDYIWGLNDGRILIFDTKSGDGDQNADKKRDALVAALRSYPSIIAGIVRFEHNRFYLDDGSDEKKDLESIVKSNKGETLLSRLEQELSITDIDSLIDDKDLMRKVV